jgi:hypothetical protein
LAGLNGGGRVGASPRHIAVSPWAVVAVRERQGRKGGLG